MRLAIPVGEFQVWGFKTRADLLLETAKKILTTGLWNTGPLKILSSIKLILNDQGNNLDSYAISLESFRSIRGPLFRKPVTGFKNRGPLKDLNDSKLILYESK